MSDLSAPPPEGGPEKTIGRSAKRHGPSPVRPNTAALDPAIDAQRRAGARTEEGERERDESGHDAPPIYSPESVKGGDRRLPKLSGEQKGIGKHLALIVELLDEINGKLDVVIAGQASDRVGKVEAGVNQFEQAMRESGHEARRALLSGAVSLLNEGRSQLARNLEGVLRRGLRDRQLTDLLWSVVFVNKPAVELSEHLEENEALIAESLYYTNQATAYLLKAYEELGMQQAAREAVSQFERYCAVLRENLFEKAPYFTGYDETRLSPESISAAYVEAHEEAHIALRQPLRTA